MSYSSPVQGNENFSGVSKKSGDFTTVNAGIINASLTLGIKNDAKIDGLLTAQSLAVLSGTELHGGLNVTHGNISIGTSCSQLGFFGTSPISQPGNIAHATDAPSAIARLNNVIDALISLGLINN